MDFESGMYLAIGIMGLGSILLAGVVVLSARFSQHGQPKQQDKNKSTALHCASRVKRLRRNR